MRRVRGYYGQLVQQLPQTMLLASQELRSIGSLGFFLDVIAGVIRRFT